MAPLPCPHAESDQNTPLAIDQGLAVMLEIVQEAKGWGREQVRAWVVAQACWVGKMAQGSR